MLLSIVAANVNSPEWAELLIKSIRKFTELEHEIIIIDNGSLLANLSWLEKQPDIKLLKMRMNIGHGAALDTGMAIAEGKYICAIDIDAHFQRHGWDLDLMHLYHTVSTIRLIGCHGPDHKPLKPPLFFFERDFFLENKLSFRYIPSISTDTAQKIYWDIIGFGYETFRLIPETRIYETGGDEFWINGKPTIYHSWYGTRFQENGLKPKPELDGYKLEDYLKEKVMLFNQPLVREILSES